MGMGGSASRNDMHFVRDIAFGSDMHFVRDMRFAHWLGTKGDALVGRGMRFAQ